MTLPNPQRHVVPTAVLTKSKLVPITVARPITTDVPKTNVTQPRQAKTVVTKPHSPPRRHINHSPSPKASTFPLKVTAVKAPMVNAVKGVQRKWEWKPKCLLLDHVFRTTSVSMSLKRFDYNDALGRSKHMTGNMSYLSNIKEINGGYVAFDGNPKGDTECIVLSPEFKLPDENQVLLRVPRENNMYNVDLKNTVTSRDLTCLFSKGIKREFSVARTPQQNGIAERKNRTIIEDARTMLADSLLPIPFWLRQFILLAMSRIGCKFDGKVDEGFLVGYSNTDGDAAFEEKEPEFKGRKPESKVYVSSSSSVQNKKHDDKTKREAKGKSPVESLTGYRNLSAEFEDFSDNSINEVNAAGNSVPAVGQNFTDSTNTFSAAGPSNADVSPTHGKSSFVDTSQLPDDPNMLELEDITYFDDEEDVGVEADFNNLETSITVSPIPTTRVHKDHPVTQIIGDLSLATQTRSMSNVAKDQCGLSQINNDDFHTLARIEAIRLFLAYASFMGFMVYQMDVKSAFLYGTIEEEVYVCQPPGFEDLDYPDKVYKVVKALYGLHQAPRAWQQGDILLVQIYDDDINFCSTNKDLSKAFEKLMKDKFQLSSIGELTFFLGLQVKQKPDGIFISQDKYVAEILRKFEGIECLPNEEIFTELSRMGYEKPSTKLTFYKAFFSPQWKFLINTILQCMSAKRTSWNEFSLSMASAVICLSAGKGFFRVDTPLFEGMIVAQKVGDGTAYVNVKDVLAAGVAAEGAASVADDDINAAVDEPSIPSPTPPTQSPLPSQDIPSTLQVHLTLPSSLIAQPPLPQQQPQPSHNAEISMDLLHTLLDICTTLTKRVENLEHDKIAQALEITKLKQRVKKLEMRNKLKVSKLRRLKKGGIIANIDADEDVILEDAKKVVVEKSADVEESAVVQGRQAESQAQIYQIDLEHVEKLITKVVTAARATITAADALITVAILTATAPTLTTALTTARRRKEVVISDPEETTTSIIIHTEPKSKDKGKRIMVHEPKPFKKKTQIEQDEAYARDPSQKNMMIYLKNMEGFKMDYFKRMSYDDIHPIFEKKFNSNVAYLEKTKEQMEKEDNKALKRLSESQKDKAAKRQKLDEAVKELRRHLQIVPNDEDDVYTEATPLALKVPVVDYEIYTEHNKPYFKIKRADGSHQLYLSLLSMIITFTTTQLILLVERKYLLTRFTLDQMLNNVHLEVEEESEVNDVTRLQALVDKKKVIITEGTIRDALRLADAEGIECLPDEEIFTELARMGYEKPSTKLTFYKQVGEGAAEVHVEETAGVAAEGAASTADDKVPTAVDEPSIALSPPPTQPPPSQDIPLTA
uniref:Putative ribonuclease H-like domain-containing protein n=1 Tax=Tanacetum cinerariifolium TaxID=118510 RepID=A0A699GXX3_TANCI|nr:putative ribonuclease H-like domain-containing protein [Tanacetum cinerariifolium]